MIELEHVQDGGMQIVNVHFAVDLPFSKLAGETLLMDSHIPDGTGPFAAVILVHGGALSNGSKQANFIKPCFRFWMAAAWLGSA